MKRLFLVILVALVTGFQAAPALTTEQPVMTLDENLWIAFYDVPSRRFRDIRAAFVKRQFGLASHDLETSANYLIIEADRALPALSQRLNEVAEQMMWIAENINDMSVTMTDLDTLFSRTHWLLSQHFLSMARNARDSRQNRNAGLYLLATTHHLERAVLWSNSRIDRDVHKTLGQLRDLAEKLIDGDAVKDVYKDKPLVRADALLRKLGKSIDRQVVIPTE